MSVSLTSKDTSTRMFMRDSYSKEDLISDEMINEYRQIYGDYIEYILLSENVGNKTLTNEDYEASILISGVNTDYKDSEELEMLTGRFINEDDIDNKNKFCVVSDRFLEDYGMSIYDAVGSNIRLTINNFYHELTIIGVYHYESETSETSSTVTTTLYMPISTAKYLSHSNDGYSSFTVVSKGDIDTTWFLDESQTFFESYYTHKDSYAVSVSNMEEMLETMTEMLGTITLAISCIAAISLVVGGIGVMNIMLVAITGRTKEIGTRKAIGASNGIIRLQFIVEAVIVCLIGGIIGIILGISLGYIGSNILGYRCSPSISSIVIAVGFSIGIGIFFGYYPANKAAKLNPIDALRYE